MSEGVASVAVSRAQHLAGAGRIEEAYLLLSRSAEAGDADSAAELGSWRMTGDYVRRDLSLARDLFGRAGELGRDDAEAAFIALLANGAGGSGRRWQEALDRLRRLSKREPLARRQLSVLESMELSELGDPIAVPEREILSSAPMIAKFDRFLTGDECAYLIARSLPILQDSVIVHPTTGKLIRDPVRTSRAAAFPFVSEDPVIHALNRRIAAASGTSYEQGEPLQVLSYEPGQEYKLHSDALPPGHNQRILTFLVYLNEDFEGGETYFPDLEVAFRGRGGDAILFRNVDEDGQPDPRARHAGRPVQRGRKMLLSKWIRSAPLDLTGPPGRPF